VISLEQSELESVILQVRDEQFALDVDKRAQQMEIEKQREIELVLERAKAEASELVAGHDAELERLKGEAAAEKARGEADFKAREAEAKAAFETRIAQLEAQLESRENAFAAEKQLAVSQAVEAMQRERDSLASAVERGKSDLEAAEQRFKVERDLAVTEAVAAVEKERDSLNAALAQKELESAAAEERHKVQQELAVSSAVSALEKERDSLNAQLKLKESQSEAEKARFKEQLDEQMKAKDQFIIFQKDEIERLKDMRAKQSTKMLGESLEIHCMNEFNSVRAMAFPNAYFERDTEPVGGSMGDFIFREVDESGAEIVSIMFEMKNEGDTDSHKIKNEQHLAKLDKDRNNKGCEYAVLVSLLEPESDLYNKGIVDVSYRYPKMYVVRPQFFLSIISLLRQAGLSALEYKREALIMRQQDLDVSTFESDLEQFKTAFFRNYKHAADRYKDAVESIDKTIKLLKSIRDNLTKSEKHLAAANNKLEDLTVKKLTRNNPTMREKFAAAARAAEAAEDENDTIEVDFEDIEIDDVQGPNDLD
ncbi:MAG: DUF2130 domain-containing protein, partial [Eggerthellaceae bacterium]|nr:DUF2130 domain-containing protein [Eggerthellaceae bacterium]